MDFNRQMSASHAMPQRPSTDASAQRVMVVEDDAKIAGILTDFLRGSGFEVDTVDSGISALRQIERTPPAAILLDLSLPDLDGLEVCTAVRKFSDVPIIMLTARVAEVDRLIGLESGADDYICKPFAPLEVIARVKALLRRVNGGLSQQQSVPWAIDEGGMRISWNGHWLPLTPLEFRMLSTMLGRPGRVFSRSQLLAGAHADFRDVSDRAIDSHIKNLRKKLQTVEPERKLIASIYGVGYRLEFSV